MALLPHALLLVGKEVADQFAAFHAERDEAVARLRAAYDQGKPHLVCVQRHGLGRGGKNEAVVPLGPREPDRHLVGVGVASRFGNAHRARRVGFEGMDRQAPTVGEQLVGWGRSTGCRWRLRDGRRSAGFETD